LDVYVFLSIWDLKTYLIYYQIRYLVTQSRRWSRGLRLRTELRGINKQISFWNSTHHPYLQQKSQLTEFDQVMFDAGLLMKLLNDY
ncbi:hypothetical protein M8C21_006209, partial [Ambrosia artemisiifolia]